MKLVQKKLVGAAVAHPNIAFIKYWGNRDEDLRLPSNGSISMALGAMQTRTVLEFRRNLDSDTLQLNGAAADPVTLRRVSEHLDRMRELAATRLCAVVESSNDFPTGAGIASSSSAFAALTLAAAEALKLDLSERELSAIARRGSGSACRSVPGGFAEWHAGGGAETSHAALLAPPDHWNLVDCIAIVSAAHKAVTSSVGQRSAATSPYQRARVEGAEARLSVCRSAILHRDFAALTDVMEEDTLLMHAVMMTSRPPLVYWEGATLALVDAIPRWREEGLPVAYTIDAGPNVHCLCPAEAAADVARRLRAFPGVRDVRVSRPGPGAHAVPVEKGEPR